jgi:hypothetical protein
MTYNFGIIIAILFGNAVGFYIFESAQYTGASVNSL